VSRIAEKFARARAENRAAFIAYLTAGDPTLEQTVVRARALERAGTDVLELGVPFSDPIADGRTLQRAAERALASGTAVAGVLAAASEIRASTELALILFSYLNPLLAFGLDRLARESRRAGIDGVLVTDLPPEEAPEIVRHFRRTGCDTVFLVSPTSPPERMRRAASLSTGFLYAVSRTGPTGTRKTLARDFAATLSRARQAARPRGLPVAVGFGIADAKGVTKAASMADGVVVGSALVAAGERGGKDGVRRIERLARKLAGACRRGARVASKRKR
jgi:tryptophan synthase alpha chain